MTEKILVVDDDKLVNEFVEETLTRSGFDVTTAMSGEDALELMEIEDFDLILADVRMPRMDGIQLLRQIKKDAPSTTVIMIGIRYCQERGRGDEARGVRLCIEAFFAG
jgi:CheY-like chemotaxis protein